MALSQRLAIAALIAIVPAVASAEPINVIRAPATAEAPSRVEAAMFSLDVYLAGADQLAALLLQSGVNSADLQSAAALAQTAVDANAPVRVKLGLSRDPDSGAIGVQRVVLSTAGQQAVIEQRDGKLKVVANTPRKPHLI